MGLILIIRPIVMTINRRTAMPSGSVSVGMTAAVLVMRDNMS